MDMTIALAAELLRAGAIVVGPYALDELDDGRTARAAPTWPDDA